MIEAYGDRVKIFTANDTLPCDVEAIAAVGHTPGHTAYLVGEVMIAGDVMHGVALQLEHPEICARFDTDKVNAVASRKMLIEKARAEGLRMYGMHFPAPYYLDLK
jgi:glyoxylase-like metal-dependent hydrolase (beta-lactamase superfamily II)